jgi:hypothetical protein
MPLPEEMLLEHEPLGAPGRRLCGLPERKFERASSGRAPEMKQVPQRAFQSAAK